MATEFNVTFTQADQFNVTFQDTNNPTTVAFTEDSFTANFTQDTFNVAFSNLTSSGMVTTVAAAETIIEFTLSQSDQTFTGGTWTFSTGVITHTDVSQTTLVYLNGVLLQEGAGADYIVTDTSITISENIRTGFEDSDNWCVIVVDNGVSTGSVTSSFVDLSDTPSSYAGAAGQLVTVNAGATAVAFTDNPVNQVLTPTATAMFTQAELDGIDADNPTLTRSIVRNLVTLANITITGSLDPVALRFNHVVTIDTRTAGWLFESATLSGNDLPFTLVVGMDHEWTASFTSDQVSGPLVINIFDPSTITGIFYNDGTNNFRLDNIDVTAGSIEDLGFQTEDDAFATFQAIETTGNEYVRTPTLADYATTAALNTAVPITLTSGDLFPTSPVNGDQHYLSTNIYADTVAFTPQTLRESFSGTGNQAMMTVRVNDPVTNVEIVAGTYFVNEADVPVESDERSPLSAGAIHTFTRGFNRDRTFNGIHTTRSQVVGTTTHLTTVSETRYDNVMVTTAGVTTLMVGATLHDYHYRLQTTSAVGGRVLRDVHFYNIQFSNAPGTINPAVTATNVIDMIEGFIQDSSALEIALTSGESTPLTFPSTSAFLDRTVTLRGLFFSQEQTTYQFIPMNGFTLDPATTMINGATTITRVIQPDGSVDTTTQVPIIGADGSVNLVVNDAMRSWAVDFIRSFPRVPTDPSTVPEASAGQYLYHGGWRPFTTTSPVVLS